MVLRMATSSSRAATTYKYVTVGVGRMMRDGVVVRVGFVSFGTLVDRVGWQGWLALRVGWQGLVGSVGW